RDKKERIPSCCKNNKWQEILERESLIKYLESERGLVEQREFFRKECNKCLKKWQITSFFLYTSVMDVE
ncbi:7526_t:CDS:1, partial [Entrophospora sp. SA101]